MACRCLHRGSAIAKIVGANAAKYDRFVTTVNMWVFEETVDGRKLTEIINTDHENVKYLPGHKLPPNVVSMSASAFATAAFCIFSYGCCLIYLWFFFVSFLHQVAVPDLVESVKGADILIFVVPHQFILRVCDTIKDHIKKDAVGMSLIKVTFSFLSTFRLFFYTFMMEGWMEGWKEGQFGSICDINPTPPGGRCGPRRPEADFRGRSRETRHRHDRPHGSEHRQRGRGGEVL